MSDRYPNRAEALALLGSTLHPRARATLLLGELSTDDDPSVEHWLEVAQTLHWQALALDSTVGWVEPDSEREVPTVRYGAEDAPTISYGDDEVEKVEREKRR